MILAPPQVNQTSFPAAWIAPSIDAQPEARHSPIRVKSSTRARMWMAEPCTPDDGATLKAVLYPPTKPVAASSGGFGCVPAKHAWSVATVAAKATARVEANWNGFIADGTLVSCGFARPVHRGSSIPPLPEATRNDRCSVGRPTTVRRGSLCQSPATPGRGVRNGFWSGTPPKCAEANKHLAN